MPALKVGLIGCGEIAQAIYLPLLSHLPEVELTALAEPDEDRRHAAARRVPAANAVADAQELLSRSDVQTVIICLPNAQHAETAVAAMEAGKHVYLEKPLALSLAEGARVLRSWRRTGVVGMIGFNYRFNPLYRSLKERLRAGAIGELVAVRTVFSTPARRMPEWKNTRHSGGGVLLDLAIHHFDLLRFLCDGEIETVFAALSSRRSEEDSALLQLRLSNGVSVQSFFSLCAQDEDRFEIYGLAGKLVADRYRSWGVEFTPTNGGGSGRLGRTWQNAPYALKKMVSVGGDPSYRSALEQFIKAARTGAQVSPNFEDGCRAQAVAEAAEQSAREGREVELPGLEYSF